MAPVTELSHLDLDELFPLKGRVSAIRKFLLSHFTSVVSAAVLTTLALQTLIASRGDATTFNALAMYVSPMSVGLSALRGVAATVVAVIPMILASLPYGRWDFFGKKRWLRVVAPLIGLALIYPLMYRDAWVLSAGTVLLMIVLIRFVPKFANRGREDIRKVVAVGSTGEAIRDLVNSQTQKLPSRARSHPSILREIDRLDKALGELEYAADGRITDTTDNGKKTARIRRRIKLLKRVCANVRIARMHQGLIVLAITNLAILYVGSLALPPPYPIELIRESNGMRHVGYVLNQSDDSIIFLEDSTRTVTRIDRKSIDERTFCRVSFSRVYLDFKPSEDYPACTT